ncbi:hypothetical protein WA026_014117 [Henosepilachna vigintioctopunctata]|uniref:Uncharacterized protein n=1 Tax=Henosepilachna vigintioctopunctata TaxID=420089 RepID=A0AAW1TLR9_9CUCU
MDNSWSSNPFPALQYSPDDYSVYQNASTIQNNHITVPSYMPPPMFTNFSVPPPNYWPTPSSTISNSNYLPQAVGENYYKTIESTVGNSNACKEPYYYNKVFSDRDYEAKSQPHVHNEIANCRESKDCNGSYYKKWSDKKSKYQTSYRRSCEYPHKSYLVGTANIISKTENRPRSPYSKLNKRDIQNPKSHLKDVGDTSVRENMWKNKISSIDEMESKKPSFYKHQDNEIENQIWTRSTPADLYYERDENYAKIKLLYHPWSHNTKSGLFVSVSSLSSVAEHVSLDSG